MNTRVISSMLLLATLLAPTVCRAWNGPGHMTVALIAYRRLDDPTRVKVDQILKSHPAFAEFKAKQPTNFPDQGAWIRMMAATWPDMIKDRQNPQHDTFDKDDPHAPAGGFHKGIHDVEHFVDLPFSQGGTPGKPPGPRTILTYLPENLGILKNGANDQAKAVALSWVLHLMGDLHQPLHCASRFNPSFPDGDQGGNLFVVMPPESHRAVKLHAYWDGLLGSSASPVIIAKEAKSILEADDLKRDQLDELGTHLTLDSWAKESFDTAVDFVYQSGDLPGVPQHTLDEDPDAPIPVLPNRYRADAMDLAERQAALASFRLAGQITDALH